MCAQDWTGEAASVAQKQLTFYELDLGLNHVVRVCMCGLSVCVCVYECMCIECVCMSVNVLSVCMCVLSVCMCV